MKKKILIISALVVAALAALGCYKYYYIDEITDYYELSYQPKHDYISGGMDVNIDVQNRNFRGFVKSDEEAVAIMEEEFTNDMKALTSAKADDSYLEHFTQEQIDQVVNNIKTDAIQWKRWLICVKHPRRCSPDDAVKEIKESYKDIIQKGEYGDGHFKVKIIPIIPKL